MESFDDSRKEFRASTLHVVYTENEKQYEQFLRRIRSSHDSSSNSGEDYGDIINYLEQYISSSHIRLIYEVRNNVGEISNHSETFRLLA